MVSFKDTVFEASVNLHRVDFDGGVDKTGSNMDSPREDDSAKDDQSRASEPGAEKEASSTDTPAAPAPSAIKDNTGKKEFNPWQALDQASKKSVSRRQMIRGAFRFLPKKEE
jgi:hypothetical protein